MNNPLNDSILASRLFYDEINQFNSKNNSIKDILVSLLYQTDEFAHFFTFLEIQPEKIHDTEKLIKEHYKDKICSNAKLKEMIESKPVKLAYCLALIDCDDQYSITPRWILETYPLVEYIYHLLRNNKCKEGCDYCSKHIDAIAGLKKYFGFDKYRKFDNKPLQENAVKAALENESLLAIFPTGGGKSIAFQIPALIAGENFKGLTIIISPLQSLMKDQIDNLEKIGITQAATINGLLDPIERQKAIERVEDGSAHILYISPESLRSKTIETLLLKRKIARFVIDEAHCFSNWRHDFRVDYLYIAEFIKNIENAKNIKKRKIPVSCFTATAKKQVIEDICNYFKDKLIMDLKVFNSNAARENLEYEAFECKDEISKYNKIRELLEQHKCPTVIYVLHTKKTEELAHKLTADGFEALPYHGRMEKSEKIENQNRFINGEIQTIVATSAFGMGVDKKDIQMVIHYEISGSLENYVQEAGRAGRDQTLDAHCYILYDSDDLNKHFTMLHNGKVTINEVKQIWRSIKYLTKYRSTMSKSALEIAQNARWSENIYDLETKVRTVISALEQCNFIKRKQNSAKIYADSIHVKNMQDARKKIESANGLTEKQKENTIRIIQNLISKKYTSRGKNEDSETRIDYISSSLAISQEEVIDAVNQMRELDILANRHDLTAYLEKTKVKNLKSYLSNFIQSGKAILSYFEKRKNHFNLKHLNDYILQHGSNNCNTDKINKILNYFAIKNWIKKSNAKASKNHINLMFNIDKKEISEKLQLTYELADYILDHFVSYCNSAKIDKSGPVIQIKFSLFDIKNSYENDNRLFSNEINNDVIKETLFYLSKMGILNIEGGFFLIYNKMTIERIEENNKIQYKKSDYEFLENFYENKTEQIHIVGEYANKLISDTKGALKFVNDYFTMDYDRFIKKYFPNAKRIEAIKKNITVEKFQEIFGELTPRQLSIINDTEHEKIVVAAGPGSGKTKLLVHKLASLLTLEDVQTEQLLMLTFSRSATSEFKKRLVELVKNTSYYVDIKTFYSYCFDLLGKMGDIEKSAGIINEVIEKINNDEIEKERLTKTVLVIDEAQDMDEDEFNLVKMIMQKNEDMRIIAVGDDDQNIYTFRGSDSKYFEQFLDYENSKKYELVQNFRSKINIVDFANKFLNTMSTRLKKEPVASNHKNNGKIKIVHYKDGHIIEPLVNDIVKSKLKGTTCILTTRNEEASKIVGLLQKNKINAKLIRSNDGFNLFCMVELKYFIDELQSNKQSPKISDENWNNAKIKFAKKYKKSSNYELCKNIIVGFQNEFAKEKYYSDFLEYIFESKIEHFNNDGKEAIVVSTIHKAKGKEFDNVVLMLENYKTDSEENKRVVYVAITRAKDNLIIHTNEEHFKDIKVKGLKYVEDTKEYHEQEELLIHLTHRDINLGYFGYNQKHVSKMHSGEKLHVKDDELVNAKGDCIVKFSKKFLEEIEKYKTRGYKLIDATISFVLWWTEKHEDEEDKELRIVLPEVVLGK